MDDNYRLLKLISLVGWANPTENKCSLRYPSEADRERLTEAEGIAGHAMCMYYAGALEYHSGSIHHGLDRRQLPDFTLDFVTNLSGDAVTLLGEMVRASLGLNPRTDTSALARRWIEDVTATCWRLALTNHEDRFGQTE